MTTIQIPEPAAGQNSVFGAFWRWHFYAGLLILPLLMLMALTGAVYLFKDEINGALHRPLMSVDSRPGAAAPADWVRATETGLQGRVAQVLVPDRPDQAVRLIVVSPEGDRRIVFVDPHDARQLGSAPEDGVMQFVKRLHSLDLAGPVANLLVEVVAGWAIIMVATGIVLWWPRGQAGGVITVRSTPASRLFWRDLHAVVGLFAGGVIVFLAVTGMPWSAVWGQQVRTLTTEAGFGRPEAPAAAAAFSHGHEAHEAADADPSLPWALQHTQMHGGHTALPGLSLAQAIAQAEANSLSRPYSVTIANEPGQAWTVSHMPRQVENTRTLYLDAADGRLLADIGYADFGPAARAIEWGIAVHQGNQFGLINKLIMLAGCISIWFLGISAVTMWWKRRPKGGLGAPRRPLERWAYAPLAAVVVPLAILYPLTGASLLAVLVIDILARRIFAVPRRPAGVRP